MALMFAGAQVAELIVKAYDGSLTEGRLIYGAAVAAGAYWFWFRKSKEAERYEQIALNVKGRDQ